MVAPSRLVKTTGPPALITVGACAVRISVPRLSCCAAMPITAISSAAARPTNTILRWVERSTVYIDQFMAISYAYAHLLGLSPEENISRQSTNTRKAFNKKCEKSQGGNRLL